MSALDNIEVTDINDHSWQLEKVVGEDGTGTCVLSRKNIEYTLPNFNVLSPDKNIRFHTIGRVSNEINLPNDVRDYWHNILSERPLTDNEVNVFFDEIRDAPANRAGSIQNEILMGQSSISSLVPPTKKYYQRLVGQYEGSISITEYANSSGKKMAQELTSWNSYDGFLFSLFMSSHSSLTSEITVEQLSGSEILKAYKYIEDQGDRISQLGAIEVGFRILPLHPDIEPIIINLIKQIRGDDPKLDTSNFRLLSALIILVDGELSRLKLFLSEPPFYRRLAAYAQAALIHRQIVNSGIELKAFCEWANNHRGVQFCMQTLVDMRIEPRWEPDLVAGSQIRAEFIGRILIAAKCYENNIKDTKIADFIYSNLPEGLISPHQFPYHYLPGPLEGSEESQNILPKEISEEIEKQLNNGEVEASSFIMLVNSALIFRIRPGQVDLVTNALKQSRYKLSNIDNKAQLRMILNGLATIAAVTRSRKLTDELRILVRVYRHDTEYALSIEEAINICLVASASCSEFSEWNKTVGEWLTELAFGELAEDEGKVFYMYLECLLHSVPELWVSCGRAEAALKAYNEI